MQNSRQLLVLAIKNQQRFISTTASLEGKRNFRKFLALNKRCTRVVKDTQRTNLNPPVPINKRGVRDTGKIVNGKYEEIPEMIPDIIVPDLEGCKLKPYVSYRADKVFQSEFTSIDLFNAVYSKKIMEDFKEGKLNEDGTPIEPSENELLASDQALKQALKTGSDIF